MCTSYCASYQCGRRLRQNHRAIGPLSSNATGSLYFFIGGGAFFTSRGEQLAALALRCAVPTVYEGRDFVMAGGLLSCGGSLTDSYRLAGRYAGRVLNGEKPADLPVQQSTKVEMFLNLRTAKTLGITLPLPLSGGAEEVIE